MKDDDKDKYDEMMKNINMIKGIFLQSEDISKETREIYTSSGSPLLEDKETFNGTCNKLTKEQKIYIENEINLLIELKYNFIHYNGFPKVEKIDFKPDHNEYNIQKELNV